MSDDYVEREEYYGRKTLGNRDDRLGWFVIGVMTALLILQAFGYVDLSATWLD
jgi:hypothetical protein